MTKQQSIAEARQNLPTLVRDAEQGETVEFTRRGRPVAVLIGCRAFKRLAAGRQSFAEAWRGYADSVDLAELALDPDELFEDLREQDTGRGVQL